MTINQALNEAVGLYKAGNIEVAKRLFSRIIQIEPNQPDANHNMGRLLFESGNLKEALPYFKTALEANFGVTQYWFGYIDVLFRLQRFSEASELFTLAKDKGCEGLEFDDLGEKINASIVEFETEIPKLQGVIEDGPYAYLSHFRIGATFQKLGKMEEAIEAYNKALSLKPDYAEAYYNMGTSLAGQGKLAEAIEAYSKALSFKPNFFEAYSNLGLALNEQGKLAEAIEAYNKALSIKPDYAGAHNNLGATFEELGKLEDAEASYIKAIELDSHMQAPFENLVEFLAYYGPQKEVSYPTVKVDQKIKEIDLKDIKEKTSGVISDSKIIQIFCKSSSIIKRHNLELGTDLSQVYRRNSVDLNCKRHKSVFAKFSVIPKFCFGCYKVQVEPRSILELIKLFVVFDQIKLVENNTRKCMIETRPEISGFYKGLIYCSSLEESYEISDLLGVVIKENIGPGLVVAVKRGCSEYAISFPDYKEINKSGPQLMNYNKNWKLIEGNHDSINLIKPNRNIRPSLSGLNLNDVLIIRNWIDYAKGIGDPSVDFLNQNIVFSQKIYKMAKIRLETHSWR